MIEGRIPRRDQLNKYDDLGALAQVLGAPDRNQIISRDFVDAKTQCREDLQRLEKVLDRIWGVVIREFKEMEHLQKYHAVQAVVTEEDIAFCASLTSLGTSGSPRYSYREFGSSATVHAEEL